MKKYSLIIIALVASIALIPILVNTAIASTCYDRFVFAWQTVNPVLSCLDDNLNLGGGATQLNDLTDVTIISINNNQILVYNSTSGQWENRSSASFLDTTSCNNLGSGYLLCAGGNVNIKSLLAGTGVSMSNNSNSVTISNTITNVENLLNTNIISPQNGEQLTYNSTSGKWENEEETEVDVGGGYSLFYTTIGNILEFKTITAGSGITISNSSNTVTITNNSPESTTCSSTNTVTGSSVCEASGNVKLKRMFASTGITISSNTTHVIFSNAGVISNSCSSGISCSGTNPSSFTNTGVTSVVSGSGMSVAPNTGTVTVTNALPESTACSNLGTGTIACPSGNVNIKSFKAGTGLSIANTTNDITYTNTGVTSLTGNSPISVSASTGAISISCTTCITSLSSGTGISISGNTITNTLPEATVCTNTGVSGNGGYGLCNGGNISLKSIKPSTGISMTNNTNDITITNSGVISNSCSSGISCSGTNPSAFTNSGVTSNVAGTGISVSGATGAVTITNTGVTSLTGTSPISASASTGAVTMSCSTCFYGSSSRIDTNIVLSTSTPSITQNTFNTATSTSTVVKAFASNLAPKALIIACEGEINTGSASTAPTDTLGLTYTSITGLANGASEYMSCWKTMSGAGGADTVTGHYGATCSASKICTLFIYEISGSDTTMVYSTSLAGASTTSPVMTSVSVTNTPLILGHYIKPTTGTDTAGASYTLSNGESGSLTYLTQKSTSITSAANTIPATFGTASTYTGIAVIIPASTTIFSIALSANTNYIYHADISTIGSATASSAKIDMHQLDSGATLQNLCLLDGSSTTNSLCTSSVDTSLTTAVSSTNHIPLSIYGAIKVGSTATTLLLEYGVPTSATNNLATIEAGSFITVSVVS